MKKFLCLFLAAVFAFAAVSCASDGGSDDDNSISSLINNGGSTVDLTGKEIKEDVSVNSTVTIKNADFGGKTLTVNAANVVLENVKNVKIVVSEKVKSSSFTIKNGSGEVSVVVKGGSSIIIKNSSVTSVSVEGVDASVSVEKTKVDSVEVKADGAAIKGGEDSSIKTVTVDVNVGTVDVADGKIENVKAGENVVINVSGDSKIDKAEGGKFVADVDVKLPVGANKIEISSVTLKKTSPKTEYEIGDRFDFSGLSVSVEYNDKTTREISLNANNVETSGFSSSSVGTCTVSFVYKGKNVSGTLSVTIKPSSKAYKILLNEGIDLLLAQKYDEGVAKIKAAYDKEKNDETKLYYALAEIATISTDSSVSNIMKNNFGVRNYPSTLNALINGEWLKEYKRGVYEDVYTLSEAPADETYYCVKVSGDRCDWNSDGEECWIKALLDEDNEWISCYRSDFHWVKNVKLDENGKYLVYKNSLPQDVRKQITDSTKKYRCSYDHRKRVLSDYDSSKFPEFNVPEWLKNSDRYNESLIKSTQTSATTSLLLWGNLVECNPNGANELIDNILKIFDGKFENAKRLADSISEGNVIVPSKVISALGLEEVLGDSSVYVGKAELNVLISSMQILKGTFQWLSSYDLSANIASAKDFFGENPDEWGFFRKLANTNSLKVRNASAMETSKKTFIEAIEILENSYNYLVSSASSYPQAAKDEVARYGNVVLAAAEDLNKCLKNDGIFYIPNENPFETLNWNASSSGNSFGIDMGKLFTAGYFSDIFERDGSDLKIDCVVDYCYTKGLIEKEGTFNLEITSDMKTSDVIEEAVENKMRELVGDDYSWMEYDARIGLKINSKLLGDLLPGLDFEGVSMIPMGEFGGSSRIYIPHE